MSTRTVLVTGGASGLGAAVVDAVQERGWRAWVLDLNAPRTGVDHTIVDLSDVDEADRCVREVGDRVDGLDGVVTCAGIDSCGRLEDVKPSDWVKVIEVNLLGAVAVVRAALPSLRKNHGRIVTVASTLGLRALPDATAYCASKFGMVGFSRALAAELAGEIGVTTLIPGGMQTAFFDGRPDQYKPPADAKLNPPSEVARAVLFALETPPGSEIRELVVTPSVEPSWP